MRLTRLADHLRAAGLPVIEVPGWETRGRGGDGGHYVANRPTHVMMHHTASNTTAARDVAYMAHHSPIAPIANLYVARGGAVHVMAAGPTNTNGRGSAPWAPFVADNDMNRHAIGVELGNAGTGEHYPEAQERSALKVTAALCSAYGIDPRHVRAHHEWAPRRKIDPSGPSRWAPDGGLWDMGSFRASVSAELRPPAPTLDQETSVFHTTPKRRYDSRNGRARTSHEVRLASGPSAALVNVTVIDRDKGHGVFCGNPNRNSSEVKAVSSVNDDADGVANSAAAAFSPDGRFFFHGTDPCHVIIDEMMLLRFD